MIRPPTHRLYRSRDHRMIAGVAGGLAEYFRIDPTIVRVAWVILGIAGGPMSALPALVIYFVLAAIVPEEPIGG